MKRKVGISLLLILVIAFFSGLMAKKLVVGVDPSSSSPIDVKSRIEAEFHAGRIPLYFIHNRGQVNPVARFYAKASRYTLWLTRSGLVFDSTRPMNEEPRRGSMQKGPHQTKLPGDLKEDTDRYRREVTRLVFLEANPEPRMVACDEAALKVNYFKGSDPKKWHCDVPTAKGVVYQSVYAGIDLKVYGMEKEVEYDWVVKAHADPGAIRFAYRNVKGTRIDDAGNLVIETEFGEMIHKKPVSYQEEVQSATSGARAVRRSSVEVGFKRYGEHTYGFEVGDYDENRELVIDPLVLLYSTYLGGAGDERGMAIAVDDNGCAYVTGYTYSTDFPTLNQYQTKQGTVSYSDCFVTKLNTNTSGAASLVYSTCIGGDYNDLAYGIDVDDNGNAYIAGYTKSTNFPTLNQYQAEPGDMQKDAFVARLNTNVSGAASLVYSTYLAGYNEDSAYGIAVDDNGNAYVVGDTTSSNFPTLNQYQTDQGMSDCFVTRLNTNAVGAASLVYSTYLGGSGGDYASNHNGIAVDGSGNAYVTGFTKSTDFPTLNQYMADPGDTSGNVFVTRIDTNESGVSSLIYSTYLGGSSADNSSGIAVDGSGHAYVAGFTNSSDFPTLNAYQTDQDGSDGFVTRLNTNAVGAASLVYSTYLGGSGTDAANGIALDGDANAYIVGETSGTDFPTLNAYMTDPGDGKPDAFVTKLNTDTSGAAGLIYSTYLGGAEYDKGYGIAVDEIGHVYVSGYTTSTDFPTVNQYMGDPGDVNSDGFIAKLVVPNIDVTAPNGGESWFSGSLCAINWLGTAGIQNVHIEFSTDNGSSWSDIAASTANDGSYDWTVPDVLSSQCLVRISDAADGNPVDTSDAVFAIAPTVITVTQPNGGEDWQADSPQAVTWTSSGPVGNVKIEYSTDNGSNWAEITASTINDGDYDWTVPDLPSTQCLVRISEAGDGDPVDTSDAVFAISVKSGYSFVSDGVWQDGAAAGLEGWYTGYFTNDVMADLMNVTNLHQKVFASDGTRFVKLGSWIKALIGAYGWFPGDFNGDGMTDLLRFRPVDRTQVFLSAGSAFVKDYIWYLVDPGSEGYTIGDFNGDGLDDMLIFDGAANHTNVYLSNGDAFNDSTTWFCGHSGEDGWYPGDFNGDGRTDIARVNLSLGTQVLLSTGSSFVKNGVWTTALPPANGWFVGDYNGDGRDDLMRCQNDISGAEVFLSIGTAFQDVGLWSDASMGDLDWRVGDYNGDGRDDLVRYDNTLRRTEVLLSSPVTPPAAAARTRPPGDDVNAGIDLSRPTLTPVEEAEVLLPWLEEIRSGEEGNYFFKIKRAYEKKLGRKVRDTVIYRMLKRQLKPERKKE